MAPFRLGPAALASALVAPVEGSNAGGLRSAEPGTQLINGITDYSGRSYDTLSDLSMASTGASLGASAESSHAGGLRTAESGNRAFNGITDFTGKSNDIL